MGKNIVSFLNRFCVIFQGSTCPECGMTFAFAGLLQVHRAKMHNVTPIPSCKQCNMVFRRVMGLINHWRTGVPHVKDRGGVKLLGCDICDSFNIINGFKNKEDIAEHTRAVHGQVIRSYFPIKSIILCKQNELSTSTLCKSLLIHL